MKKNLITVIILALVVVNLVLTAVLTITIVPEVSKANELITKVCSAIDLDLQAGDTAGALSINVNDMVDYSLGDALTINLKDNGDGKDHFAVLTISLSLDSTNADFATYGSGDLSTYLSMIRSEVNTVVSKHTIDDMRNNEEAVKEEILENLQTLFKSNFIVRVNFSGTTYQ
ncbi:MAG: flagellar basal body-associated FliL family protein [Pseudobutyrivibrio sp.]|nr:flagellar basal body-associated FliL family protein [Pseudobutyrivibrio sp.]